MRKFTRFLILICCFVPALSFCQRIDNSASYRNVTGDKYFRLHYDNDFFTKTDYYYTQGYQFELVQPFLKYNPASKLLLRLNDSRTKYGLSFEHYGFTPTSIRSDAILKNDRPFAGVILLKSFVISVNPIRKERLTTLLSTGMVGPAAFAGKMQATIHRWSGDAEPHGWQYQIRNDVILNYELNHEKELVNVPNIVSVNTNVQLRLGTFSDKIQTGATVTLGRFDSPFRDNEKVHARNFQLYAYAQPLLGFVGYDATIQGGLFNRTSPYTLQADQINRIVFQNNYGIVAHVWKIYLEYYRTYLSKEFKSGNEHGWGGVKVGYAF